MIQLRANADMSQDIFRGETLTPKEWAEKMDAVQYQYRKSTTRELNLLDEESEIEQQQTISVIRKSDRNGKGVSPDVICYKCKGHGHLARDCPSKEEYRGPGRRYEGGSHWGRGRGGYSGVD